MTWFLDLARFARERKAIDALAAEPWLRGVAFRVDAADMTLKVDADLFIGEALYEVTVHYPAHFPTAPLAVKPRSSDERWSNHQYGPGGELCLEIRPDNWESRFSAADMLRSAHRLLATEGVHLNGAPAVVPNAHRATDGQALRSEWRRMLLTPAFEMFVRAQSAPRAIKLFYGYANGTAVLIPSRDAAEGAVWSDPQIPAEMRDNTWFDGYALTLEPDDERLARLPAAARSSGAELRSLLLGSDAEPFKALEAIVVALPTGIRSYYIHSSEEPAYACAIVTPKPANRALPERERLAAFKIAVIGCGALGSKAATTIARSGARDFLLVDDDVLLPENLARHELDWTGVGFHKVDALAKHLSMVDARVAATVVKQRVGGQEAAQTLNATLAKIAACDIIVDATASAGAFNYLAGIAQKESKPVAWSRVFAGGYGGLIARSRPGIDPPPTQMRAEINAWCANPDFPPSPQGTVDYGGFDDEGEPMIADDADVAVIAAHLARLAIDTLLAPQASTFENSAYLVGLRKEWIFEAAFDTRPIAFSTAIEHSADELSTDDRNETAKALLEILAESRAKPNA